MDRGRADADGLRQLPNEPARRRLSRSVPEHRIANQPIHAIGRQRTLAKDLNPAMVDPDGVAQRVTVNGRCGSHETMR
jgi:hypothetical protein